MDNSFTNCQRSNRPKDHVEALLNIDMRFGWLSPEEARKAKVFEVSNRRMSRQINPGAQIVALPVIDMAAAEGVVIIEAKGNRRILGRIKKGDLLPDNRTFNLLADNSEFPPIEIKVSDLLRVYSVKSICDSPLD